MSDIIRDFDEYSTSRDYDFLYDEAQRHSVVCVVDHLECRDVAQTIYCDGITQVSARGISYVYARNKAEFVNQCTRLNLVWLTYGQAAVEPENRISIFRDTWDEAIMKIKALEGLVDKCIEYFEKRNLGDNAAKLLKELKEGRQ